VVLSTHGLTVNFGALRATDGVSLDLKTGEIHAIIGPNGAGKSTLIKQICGELRSDSGSVTLDGKDVSQLSMQARARAGLARTFQISQLATEDSTLENVILGAIGATSSVGNIWRAALSNRKLLDRATTSLERLGLSEFRHVKCSELSHGQRRQLELAIALTLSPKVFIMDEPMAGLGTEGSVRMTKLLDELRNEAPIILVEHDMDAVFALADRISVLVYGKIIETGTSDQIKASRTVREAYLGEE